MSKGQDAKKSTKKAPQKTKQEKKAAKRDKKSGGINTGILTPTPKGR